MKSRQSFTLSTLACSVMLMMHTGHSFAAQDRPQNIDIPAQNIDSALLELAEESQTQILFSSAITPAITTREISATLTVEEALNILLENTSLEYIKRSASTFVIREKNSVSQEVPQAKATNTSNGADATITATSGTQTKKADGEASVERIRVVGSNIRVNQDSGALPITTFSAEDFEDLGISSGADLLAELPQQGEVSFNSERVVGGVNDARGDVSSINLRGIGTGYSLTLLNGRRLVLHPGTQAEDLVPVTTVNSNALPVRGLKRVEVLRDGAAAIYGTDAIAGVINYVLKDKNTGGDLQLQYGKNDGTDKDTISLSGSGGWFFNNEQTHLTLSASLYEQDMLMASERDYAASSDTRNFPGLEPEFVGNTSLDGRTTSSPWAELSSDSLGTFHIQPDTFAGCEVALGNNICADGGSLDRELRFDSNSERSLSSEVSRVNLYALLTHNLTDEVELYGEALYYQAEADRLREQSGNLTAQRFTISSDAFYNPFGEDVTLRRYRPIDTGPRKINVEDYSYRFLTGLRGYFQDWDWDTALLYSKAHTLDSANRVNSTLFQQAVNSTDQSSAYDIFNGGSLDNPNIGDATGNPQDVIDSFMFNIERESETELALYDFKISRPDLFALPAGDVGMAVGIEYRYESFSDARSDALNGTDNFIDVVTGQESTLASTVLGSSPTPDSSGSRNVFSTYLEFAVPLLADLPGVQSLNMQLAARYERFSDVGDITKPKISLAWQVNDMVQLRAAYAEGFKAPGLPQTTAVDVSRSNTRSDPISGIRQGTLEIRNGSDDLKPETSTNTFTGIVFTPTANLTLTADWWHIKQKDVVGILSSQTQILYDALLRVDGSSNANVIRDDNNEILYVTNDYTNLLPREIKGIDYSIFYKLDTELGKFTFTANAANLKQFDQGLDTVTQRVVDAQAAGNEAVLFNGEAVGIPGAAGDLLTKNGRPEWRSNIGLKWQKDNWGAGVKYKYISELENIFLSYFDESDDLVYQKIDNWSTVDAYVNYSFTQQNSWLNKTKVTLGARNIGDKEPPFTSGTFGYESSVHSSSGRYLYMTLNKKF
ncbi:TonB-dependent receptor [Paraglaciecola polaris]|uniref:Outer membrane protein n=1 Tax=Paraglaciecola polaris LMG 21857 TaxID=1129793 RepID=K7A7V9_9ALTE|nr:TonB-dependent receptor [Paraglaciecola polaris]GAC31545.1 outer membrane protein [Paraglaciecola polaris LMG 21857]|tara:strand:- start:7674 stop:10850 length:3177 start_codon:yes stop_codon:yes gene_type:complete